MKQLWCGLMLVLGLSACEEAKKSSLDSEVVGDASLFDGPTQELSQFPGSHLGPRFANCDRSSWYDRACLELLAVSQLPKM